MHYALRVVCRLWPVFVLMGARSLAVEVPAVSDPALQVELFAQEPLITHPIGMAFTADGKLLVIQSHTHFRPQNYVGPEHDRILWLRDTDADGRAETADVFFEGTDMTMDVATAPDGRIYVATRNEILRMADKHGQADKVERRLVFLETEGRYPHNGLSGLAFDGKGGLYFGLGENLGVAYTLIGSDGGKHSGRGEGGKIFHVTADGSGLRCVAGGFWNPFGICVDSQGVVFATDNDPDSRPPCRLHHVIEGGDYGYHFLYGRSGLHPFNSWDGELPGTLPMLAGTGEAPCDVICCAPRDTKSFRGLTEAWHGQLLVASWTDHSVEAFELPDSARAFDRAVGTALVQGGADFRPVAFAVAADGSVYVSDWVKRDYELHGFGRVWRVSAKTARPFKGNPSTPNGIASRQAQLELITGTKQLTSTQAGEWLKDPNPWRFATAVRRLAADQATLEQLVSRRMPHPRQRAGVLLAVRQAAERTGGAPLVSPAQFLRDADPVVRLLALKWISDHRLSPCRPDVEHVLTEPGSTPEIFYGAVTALNRIDAAEIREPDLLRELKERIARPDTPDSLKKVALTILPDRDRHLMAREVEPLLGTGDASFREWLLRVIGTLRDPGRVPLLRHIAFDSLQPAQVRAAAIDALPAETADVEALVAATKSADATLRRSAVIALGNLPLEERQRETLQPLLAARSHAAAPRPPFGDIGAWRAFLARVPGNPDLAHGRSVFLNPKLGTCVLCHRVDGIGAAGGPELSRVGESEDPNYVLESLLQPSRNVAPRYECFLLQTTDGQSRSVFQLMERGGRHTYVGLDGKPFEVSIEEILRRDRLPVSIMPEGLVTRFSDEELRDLVAWLESRKAVR